ncbi:helix-turn-helix domain-containing protein [Streptomyces sparsogenes]|uniref:helix-turn-helix domain-containing protein n=1 Tax=Streptomyces sparsogenes TaxID=67365 RepID=UPI00340AC75E
MRAGSTMDRREEAPRTVAGSPGARFRMAAGLDIVIREAAPLMFLGAGGPGPGPHLVAREAGEFLFVGVRDGGGVSPGPGGPGTPLRPGDILFYDTGLTHRLDLPPGSRLKVFLLSRTLIGVEDSGLRRLTAAPVRAGSRLGSLVSPFLSELAEMVATADPAVSEAVARNAVDLLATLVMEQLAPPPGDIADARRALLPRIQKFIEQHLSDPDLSPESIARAHHISVRYLHKLFRDEGTTVGRWVRHRRLEECQRELVRAKGRRTIAAVARRWGFISPTHFSRVFRATYGMSPSEWQGAAG